jgi:hypothetical protein
MSCAAIHCCGNVGTVSIYAIPMGSAINRCLTSMPQTPVQHYLKQIPAELGKTSMIARQPS